MNKFITNNISSPNGREPGVPIRVKPFAWLAVGLLTATILVQPVLASSNPAKLRGVEEQIAAALEEANSSLGGGFEFFGSKHEMRRTIQENPMLPEEVIEGMVILQYDDASRLCVDAGFMFNDMHGCATNNGGHDTFIAWSTGQHGPGGKYLEFQVSSYPLSSTGAEKADAMPLAEALYQAAANHGLYEAYTGEEEILPPVEEQPTQTMPEEKPQEQLEEKPSDDNPPADVPIPFEQSPEESQSTEMPIWISIGNWLVPILGAVAGSVMGAILALTSAKPAPPTPSVQVTLPASEPELPSVEEAIEPACTETTPAVEEEPLPEPPAAESEPAPETPQEEAEQSSSEDKLRSQRLGAAEAKATISQVFGSYISPARLDGIEPENVIFQSHAEFIKCWNENQTVPMQEGTHAYTLSGSRTIYVDQDNYYNYDVVHEMMHLSSSYDFRQAVKHALNEATTDYFTTRLAQMNNVEHVTRYNTDGSTQVIEKISDIVGEDLLRKAYFGSDRVAVDQLISTFDDKLKPGAFNELIDFMNTGKMQEALQLVGG